ncbi:putative ABC transport system permease protein [Lentzea xinjiangensis]|uniref:Putative ABC transport system permease protein n=1 Tax=Lentzea xinjiangensis TaxID=402600 RepID=A0A1H9VWQ9_9PSEU|nr:FtsX-like permease family protein [Lentzea xinjiangensis]SES25961.1 putative ABC transport system permease protein [Lentzea xinjiangensis]
MLSLAWQTVKARTSGFIGAFVAVLCGTALVAACGILMESGFRGGVPTQRYAATDVVVSGDRTVRPPGGDVLAFEHAAEQPAIPAALVGKIAAVPGVRAAVPEQTFPAVVVGQDGQPLADRPSLGHNWQSAVLAPFTLQEGRAPEAAGEVVLDSALAAKANTWAGGEVRITTRSAPVTYRVSGIAATADIPRQAAVFFSEAEASGLAGRPDRVTAIGVLAEPGAHDLAGRLEGVLAADHVTVSTGADRSAAEFDDVSQTKSILAILAGSFGGYAVLVAIFVVASTLALGVEQRRREFALLRAVGATPRQVRKLIGVETTVVSAVAGVLGSLLGIAVSNGLRDAFAKIGVVPADFALTISPIPLVAALLIGVAAARIAAWSASRRPSSISPVEALGEAAVQRRDAGRVRLAIGWVLLGAGLAATTTPLFLRGQLGAAMSVLAALVLITGLSLVGPRVVGAAVRLIAPVLGRTAGVSGYLAAANVRKNSRRLAAAITPLMLAIGFAVVNFYSQTTFTAAVQQETTRSITADHVITGGTGVPVEISAAAREIPGATATSLVRTQVITATETGDGVEVQRRAASGLDASAGGTVDLGVTSGRLADLTAGTVALSAGHASWEGKEVGDTVEFWFADGQPARLRVVATYEHDLAFGDYVLAAADARAHTTAAMDSAVLVDSADVTALRELTSRYPGLRVEDRVAAQEQGDQRTQFLLNLVAVGVILGYVAISVSNTLVMSTAARRREFALLRLVGTGRRQVVRMMRAEAVVTVGLAAVLGTAVAAVPLAVLAIGLTGSPLPAGGVLVYLGVLAGAAVLGVVSIAVSTRLSLRGKPIDTIGTQA